jgi:tetratricopeptide (TPR) repeat protein
MIRRESRRLAVSLVVILAAVSGWAQETTDWDRGVAALQKKDYATAAKEFEAVIQRAPDYAGAYYMLGLTQRSQNKTSQALGNLRKAAELDGAQVLYQIELGNTLVQAGQYQDGFKVLQAVKFSGLPANYRTTYALAFAKAASEINRSDAAIPILIQQTKTDATNANLFQALGASQSAMGDSAKAFDAYKRAYELEPGNAEVGRSAVKAGILQARRTNADSAKKTAYIQAASVAEKLASALPGFENDLLAGESWMGAKDYTKAMSWFRKAQQKQSRNVLVHFYMSQCNTSLGNLDAALTNLQEALKIGASDRKTRTQIYNQLGYVYDKKKDYQKGISAYQEAGNAAMVAELRSKADLAAQNAQADQEQAEFRRKLQALELQIQELEKLGEQNQADELRRQLNELKKALSN